MARSKQPSCWTVEVETMSWKHAMGWRSIAGVLEWVVCKVEVQSSLLGAVCAAVGRCDLWVDADPSRG